MTAARMQRPSYLKLARELRQYADQIEANSGRETPQQRRLLTVAIAGAKRAVNLADHRHNGWGHFPPISE